MHLISALAAGIKGAESGTAEVYIRGTTSRATYYTDFEGNGVVSSGADVSLDANGGAVVYVNQYVEVWVKDSSGALIRNFDDGYSANNIEYIGDSFTGVDYDDASTGVSKPVTVNDLLSLWNNSAGSPDWKVLINGSATNISNALGSVSGMFFNVKDPAYGAVGDGATDDRAAIALAILAANAVGGIVYFPGGTYRVTTALNVPYNVALVGTGPDSSIMDMNSATAVVFNFTAPTGANGLSMVTGLGFQNDQANSGAYLTMLDSDCRVIVDNCHFDGANSSADIINDTGDFLSVKNCVFECGASTDQAIQSTSYTLVEGCQFVCANNYNSNVIFVEHASIAGCTFFCSAGAGAGANYIYFDNDGGVESCRVSSCYFSTDINGNVTAFNEADPDHSSTTIGIVEHTNVGGVYRPTLATGSIAAYRSSWDYWGSRKGRKATYSQGAAGTVPLNASYAEVHQVVTTHTSGTVTITSDALCPEGNRLVVQLCNDGIPGTQVISFGVGGDFSTTIALNAWTPAAQYQQRIIEFISTTVTDAGGDTRLIWQQVSDSGALAPQ
jgi:hypothetical protein